MFMELPTPNICSHHDPIRHPQILQLLSTQISEHPRRDQEPLPLPPPNLRHDRIHIFQKVVRVPDEDPHDGHIHRIPHEESKSQHDPWQIWRGERYDSEHAHSDIFIPPSPHICHHEGQCRSEEVMALQKWREEAYHSDAE